MDNLKILSQGKSNISNRVIRKKIGVLPSLILSEMVYLSDLSNEGWFPMEWDYLREEFDIKGMSPLKKAVETILALGIFEYRVINNGSGSKRNYRITTDFTKWFEDFSGITLTPTIPQKDEPVIDEIHSVLIDEKAVIDENLGMNFIDYPSHKSNIVESKSNKKNAATRTGQTFFKFYEENVDKISEFIRDEGIESKEAISRIDNYYSKMTYKNKLRSADDWFERICRYIKMYATPSKLNHAELSISGNRPYLDWVAEATKKYRHG